MWVAFAQQTKNSEKGEVKLWVSLFQRKRD